jgi:hypothetical protein
MSQLLRGFDACPIPPAPLPRNEPSIKYDFNRAGKGG